MGNSKSQPDDPQFATGDKYPIQHTYLIPVFGTYYDVAEIHRNNRIFTSLHPTFGTFVLSPFDHDVGAKITNKELITRSSWIENSPLESTLRQWGEKAYNGWSSRNVHTLPYLFYARKHQLSTLDYPIYYLPTTTTTTTTATTTDNTTTTNNNNNLHQQLIIYQ